MIKKMNRRAALGGLMAAAASPLLANAPDVSIRPMLRPAGGPGPLRPMHRPGIDILIEEAGLGGITGYMLADARTGRVIEAGNAGRLLPPASVTKAVTSLFALETLGPEYRFETRVFADGVVTDGVLDGTLILAGGGNPELLTDDLHGLAAQVAALGIKEAKAFEVWGGALPYVDEIDPAQLDHLGYNPSLSGLNLNFNRVHFEWRRGGGSYQVSMDARSDNYRPDVQMARMQVIDRDLPIYTYASTPAVDEWTVSRRALGDSGSRWLPVRLPELYAGDVFRTFARSAGVSLPACTKRTAAPTGNVIAIHQSAPLPEVIRECLKYSTNITAEALGLTASTKRGGAMPDLETSAMRMDAWIKNRTGAFVGLHDHSGLSSASRISAAAMTRLLASNGVVDLMSPLMKDIAMTNTNGDRIDTPFSVKAKTGTLNFVSTLAGYIHNAQGDYAFTIFSANFDRRAAIDPNDEQPAGTREWNARAKRLQQVILQRWG